MSHSDFFDQLRHREGTIAGSDGQLRMRCPCHDDHNPSLSVRLHDNLIQVHCFAGCPAGEVAKALGVPPRNNGRPMKHTEYVYRDEARQILYRVVRTADKKFFQQRWSHGQYLDGMKDVRRVLYRLPELLAADPSQWVFVVEGEKDVESLLANGAVATCNVGGAGKWSREFSASLAGRKVAILPDNDAPGAAHAQLVANHLVAHAAEVRVCPIPLLKPKGDVTDYFLNRGTLHDLLQIVDTYGPFIATEEAEVLCLASLQTTPVEWLWSGLVPVGKVTMLSGDPSLGKSFVTLDLLARLTTGRPMPGDTLPRPPRTGLLLSCEDDPADTILPRFLAAGGDPARLHVLAGFRDKPGAKRIRLVSLTRDIELLAKVLGSLKDVGLVVIDPISAYLDGTDANSNAEVRNLLASLASLANEYHTAFLIVSHLRKKDSGKALYRTAGSLAWTAAAR
ncbi:MAG: AAA family ATPase, partial [Planctomycetaceae bacterium]|nr:AAA family ATPase [Planctomycetaceae bacterium]